MYISIPYVGFNSLTNRIFLFRVYLSLNLLTFSILNEFYIVTQSGCILFFSAKKNWSLV